ncbi:MAG: hypothetical protein R2828_25740 [Saprospiraceae bacterium]
MKKLQHLKQQMNLLRWNATGMQIEQLLHQAQEQQPSYLEWLLGITQCEIDYKHEKAMERRLKKQVYRSNTNSITLTLAIQMVYQLNN